MADTPPPRGRGPREPEIDDDPPLGEPRYGWFAGVIEGRIGDADGLRGATDQLARLDVVACDLEIEGGRFSFMFDEQPVAGAKLTIEKQDGLVDGLQRLVDAAAGSSATESTLRGSLVHADCVIETLFAVRDGRIDPVSRRRALEERDRALAPGGPGGPGAIEDPLARIGRQRAIALIALILVGGGLLAWSGGYVDVLRNTFLSRAASELESDTGPFADALTLEVEQRFGKYVCEIGRGPGYPATADEVEALIDAAVTAEERAAASAIGDGRTVGVVLVDDEGAPLTSAPVPLAKLLADEDATIEVTIAAKLAGTRVELSIDPSPRRKDREKARSKSDESTKEDPKKDSEETRKGDAAEEDGDE